MASGTAKYINQSLKKKERVYLVGTASATFDEGIGVCYNRDYGTATAKDNVPLVIDMSGVVTFGGTTDSTTSTIGWVFLRCTITVAVVAAVGKADDCVDSVELGPMRIQRRVRGDLNTCGHHLTIN